MEGFLFKKSPIAVKGWQKRYFIDTSDYLLYFKDVEVGLPPFKPKGVIKKADIKKLDYLDAKKNEFMIAIGKREFMLRAENQEQKEKWLDALRLPLNQVGKDKYLKLKWKELGIDQVAGIYLERERILREKIKAEFEAKNMEALKAKRLNELVEKFGDNAFDYIFTAFVKKPSVKTLGARKLRWIFIINTLSLFSQEPISNEQQSTLPQMFGLDIMYCFKFENSEDRTVYTKLKPKTYEIQTPQLIIDVDFAVQFKVGERELVFYFDYLSQAKGFLDMVKTAKLKQNTIMECQQKNKQSQQLYVEDPRKVRGNYAKGKIIIESQMEKKINQSQWKNALITLKQDFLYWLYVDQVDLEFMELYKIAEIEKSYRIFTIITKKGERMSFKCATPKEVNDWCDQLSLAANVEIKQTQQQATQMALSSYQRQSISSINQNQQQQQQQQQKTPPIQQKPSFFDKLFCFGNERQPIDN